jgi:hypothetical protein
MKFKHKMVLIGLLVAGSAHAQFRTGNQLLSDMQETTGYTKGMSMGYIMGVTDAGNGVNHCPPANATAGQINDMVRNTLIDIPEVRHVHAASIIEYVLNKTWPCAKKGQKL